MRTQNLYQRQQRLSYSNRQLVYCVPGNDGGLTEYIDIVCVCVCVCVCVWRVECVDVEAGGTYSNHCAVNVVTTVRYI